MDFKFELNKYANIIEQELNKNIRKNNCPEEVLNQAMEYSLMAGGKRIRPVLIISIFQLFKEDYTIARNFAVAMEMVHTFSLIHDDLPAIDDDDFRRGKLTNHKKFNESTAILAGDALLNNAYMIISNEILNSTTEEERALKIRAFKEFSEGVDRMIAGEYVDTEYEGQQISSEYLEYMHNNKTGALIKASVRIGAILAGAPEEEIESLTNYADKIGLTFQIRDDILAEIGDEKILGKPVGNDREKNKCTFVTKYGLEESKEMLDKLTKEAIEIISLYGEKAQFFIELANYIANREK